MFCLQTSKEIQANATSKGEGTGKQACDRLIAKPLPFFMSRQCFFLERSRYELRKYLCQKSRPSEQVNKLKIEIDNTVDYFYLFLVGGQADTNKLNLQPLTIVWSAVFIRIELWLKG